MGSGTDAGYVPVSERTSIRPADEELTAKAIIHCEDCTRACLNRNPGGMCHNYEGDIRPLAQANPYADASQKVASPTGGTKNDLGKPRDILLHKGCPLALEEAVKVMTMGAEKYGDYNWKEVELERYHSAMHRHLRAYYNNPTSVDKDSSQSHLSHVLTNVLFLVQLEREQANEL